MMNSIIEGYVHLPLQGGKLQEKSSKYNYNSYHSNNKASLVYIGVQGVQLQWNGVTKIRADITIIMYGHHNNNSGLLWDTTITI